jgi:hypothetical protein
MAERAVGITAGGSSTEHLPTVSSEANSSSVSILGSEAMARIWPRSKIMNVQFCSDRAEKNGWPPYEPNIRACRLCQFFNGLRSPRQRFARTHCRSAPSDRRLGCGLPIAACRRMSTPDRTSLAARERVLKRVEQSRARRRLIDPRRLGAVRLNPLSQDVD